MSGRAITVLVVGVGKTGAEVLRQLLKNPDLRIVTLDPRENPYAIQEGILADVDFKEPLTPLSIDSIIQVARPDLVLLTTSPQDMGLGEAAGIDVLSAALHDELATIADVPVIKIARSVS
jgi:carbamoylphosphate synthase large subunit